MERAIKETTLAKVFRLEMYAVPLGRTEIKLSFNTIDELTNRKTEDHDTFEVLDYEVQAGSMPCKFGTDCVPACSFDNVSVLKVWWDEKEQGKDRHEAMFIVATHLMNLFNCNINFLKIVNISNQLFLNVINRCMEKQESIPTLVISTDTPLSEEVLDALERIKVTETLSCMLNDQNHLENFTTMAKEVNIIGGYWFTLEHLRSMQCETLCVFISNWTNQDFDDFLAGWRKGSFPYAKEICIFTKILDTKVHVDGKLCPIKNDMYNSRETDANKYRRFAITTWNIEQGIEIQRDGGIKARLLLEKSTINEFRFLLSVCI